MRLHADADTTQIELNCMDLFNLFFQGGQLVEAASHFDRLLFGPKIETIRQKNVLMIRYGTQKGTEMALSHIVSLSHLLCLFGSSQQSIPIDLLHLHAGTQTIISL